MAQEGFRRRLTSILSADAVGFSRLMGDDEAATVHTIISYRNVISTLIKQHNGIVIDSPGDNLLAEFVSVVDAVQCAVVVQKELKARNDELPEHRRMPFRIGINLGDVIQEDDRIYGDGVNIAARLEGLAEPGGICISKTAFDHIESKLPYGYEFLGDHEVKNITKPVGAYRVLLEPRVTFVDKTADKKPKVLQRMPILLGAVLVFVLAVAAGIWQFYVHEDILAFADIKISHFDKNWIEIDDQPSNSPFLIGGSRYFQLNKFVFDAHLNIDVLIVNKKVTPVVLTAFGIEIVKAKAKAVHEYMMGASSEAAAVYIGHTHTVDIPNINRNLKDGKLASEEIISTRLNDPIYFKPGAPYRFSLQLKNYQVHMPNHSVIRIWLKTDKGISKSETLEIFTK